MPRPSSPWFRAGSDCWMVNIAGHQHKPLKGKRNKKAALVAFGLQRDHDLPTAWETFGPDSIFFFAKNL